MSYSAELWLMEAIGKFLLDLYHQQMISPRNNWLVSKSNLDQKFKEFLCMQENVYLREKFEKSNTTTQLGTLLERTNYLWNSKHTSKDYLISYSALFHYSNQKLEEYDEKHRKTIEDKELEMQTATEAFQINGISSANNEKDEIGKSLSLIHKKITLEDRSTNSMLANMCLSNFPIFKLSYTKLNLLSLTIETAYSNIIIDKIMLMRAQATSVQYLNSDRMPLDLFPTNKLNILVNFETFSILLEYAVFIVFHDKDKEDMHIVEKHQFERTEGLPLKINIKTKKIFKPLSNKRTFKSKFELSQYTPTTILRSALKKALFEEHLCGISTEFSDYISRGKALTQQNIHSVMNILLQVEDIDTLHDYSKLIQRNVKLRKQNDEYAFDFDNSKCIYNENLLTSCNKILIIPETVAIKTLDEDILINFLVKDKFKNSTNIHQILWGELQYVSAEYLSFTCNAKLNENQFYMIIFRPPRLTLCYQYRALKVLAAMPAGDINRCLFPKCIKTTGNLPDISLELQNKRISDNPEQLQAVRYIIDDHIKNAPYIIFGPPGTGKTTTVVEAILQLYFRRPDTKILVLAGSNSACDEITLRLCEVISTLDDQHRSIFRVYSHSYEKRFNNINKLILQYSNLYTSHFYPDIELLHEFRIVVCTLSTVGKLALGNFGKTNKAANSVYTHVFIDEIAALSEPETLVGIVCTLSAQVNLIISGDHKQLGPVIKSQRAKDLGLSVSMMERLLERDCYAVDEQGNYDRSLQIRLMRNYRSHPKIVNLYNHLYYNNELKAMLADDGNILCAKWHRSPNPKYPIIFYAVRGNSQSNCNRRELDVVMNYVKDLMYFGVNGVQIKQEDIGIISPYKKQYEHIQKELNLRQWYHIETGSAEIFRGKEKLIIIVSFVRSFTETLGFLDEPKRLNVILSRAKSLLILIGNTETLSINADLKYVIEECRKNNTFETGTILRRNNDARKSVDAPIRKQRSSTVNLKQQQRKINEKSTLTHRRKQHSRHAGIPKYPCTDSTQSCIEVQREEQRNYIGIIPQPPVKQKSKSKCFSCCIIA